MVQYDSGGDDGSRLADRTNVESNWKPSQAEESTIERMSSKSLW